MPPTFWEILLSAKAQIKIAAMDDSLKEYWEGILWFYKKNPYEYTRRLGDVFIRKNSPADERIPSVTVIYTINDTERTVEIIEISYSVFLQG